MTLLKDYSAICFIQLLNGQNLLASKITKSNDALVLEKPRMLIIQSNGRGGGQVVMLKIGAPFIESGDSVEIAATSVMTIIEVSSLITPGNDTSRLIEEYKRQVSPITTKFDVGNLAGFKAQ